MQDQWFRTGQGFLVVYSVINRKSFREVRPLREKIHRIKDAKKVPMVLVRWLLRVLLLDMPARARLLGWAWCSTPYVGWLA